MRFQSLKQYKSWKQFRVIKPACALQLSECKKKDTLRRAPLQHATLFDQKKQKGWFARPLFSRMDVRTKIEVAQPVQKCIETAPAPLIWTHRLALLPVVVKKQLFDPTWKNDVYLGTWQQTSHEKFMHLDYFHRQPIEGMSSSTFPGLGVCRPKKMQ